MSDPSGRSRHNAAEGTSRTPVTRRRLLATAGGVGLGALAGCVRGLGGDDAGEPSVSTVPLAVDTLADGFTNPWSLAFLPDDGLLITERPGRLSLLDRASGDRQLVDGVPTVDARSQGGLLDVATHPSYPTPPVVFFTYSATNDAGETATHIGRARLDRAAGRLEAFEVVHAATPFVDSTGHYGSRIAFDDDNRLYVTVGDRQFKNFGPDHVAQRLDAELGVVLRLELDGSVPADNPFVDDPDARDAIYSYGHRNPQGLCFHPETGVLFESEYGEQDGDEINVIEAGANYGWPVADDGCTYGEGEPIGVGHDDRDDVVAPVHSWPCGTGGFPPGGMTVYTGDAFPEWHGDLFVGGLASRSIAHLSIDGTTVTGVDRLLTDRGDRIRTVATAPETDALYAAVDADDAPILKLTPA